MVGRDVVLRDVMMSDMMRRLTPLPAPRLVPDPAGPLRLSAATLNLACGNARSRSPRD